MPLPDPLVQRILGLLLPLGPVEARRMFGGYGLYLEGVIFALVFDKTLFLKAGEKTKAAFETKGLGPLTYEGQKGQLIALPYWEAPRALLKDGKALCRWARQAHQAGLRFNAKKKPKASKPKRDTAPGGARGPRFEPDF